MVFIVTMIGRVEANLRSYFSAHEELVRVHKEQARALYDGGVDILLLETIYDMKSGLVRHFPH